MQREILPLGQPLIGALEIVAGGGKHELPPQAKDTLAIGLHVDWRRAIVTSFQPVAPIKPFLDYWATQI